MRGLLRSAPRSLVFAEKARFPIPAFRREIALDVFDRNDNARETIAIMCETQ